MRCSSSWALCKLDADRLLLTTGLRDADRIGNQRDAGAAPGLREAGSLGVLKAAFDAAAKGPLSAIANPTRRT